ncbi:GyrI-like domain-containing protein [Paracidovorax valerianellae]|uniref:Predicted transcriptional regulator YdeE, contains AraC-type DNA-binding domain n=1 Tax=Paracidovorax valerianellae TaxID=187868 RepID=A0A1G6XYI4_9BURK|nr:GyrI-like domain-containing protein [Paracidovorax valerianellae]MDA8443582.1 GyrI-like domain-containing protein [Paracidovorax valerianellae]SDD82517.1 Predicted transcriptional regulator YdeE, contains AraC-type DNA-binding domain [Paracidovorax valerianellae]
MTPTRETVGAFTVAGIATRTNNRDERDPAQARLGTLWQRFFAEGIAQQVRPGEPQPRVMGVYSGYASDQDGDFDVLAGVALDGTPVAPGFTQVAVPAGEYLVFRRQGTLPQAVIDTWIDIWHYFQQQQPQQQPPVRRRFAVDFEAYEGPDRVAVYIGVLG